MCLNNQNEIDYLSHPFAILAVKRREAKSKGEKERYTHLKAEFQRTAKRDKTVIPYCEEDGLGVPLVSNGFGFLD